MNAYNHHRGTQRLVRKVFALGYLPVVLVIRHNFTTLRDSAQAQRVIELYPAVGDFLAYIADKYINGEFPHPNTSHSILDSHIAELPLAGLRQMVKLKGL